METRGRLTSEVQQPSSPTQHSRARFPLLLLLLSPPSNFDPFPLLPICHVYILHTYILLHFFLFLQSPLAILQFHSHSSKIPSSAMHSLSLPSLTTQNNTLTVSAYSSGVVVVLIRMCLWCLVFLFS